MSEPADFGKNIEAIAREFWGEPNKRLSRPRNPRWGSHGAKSVDTEKGTWFDNELKEGGGALALVESELNSGKVEALEWLEQKGFIEPKENGRAPQRSKPVPENRNSRKAADSDPPQRREIVAEYEYTDEDGNPLFVVVRYKPKDFRQRKPDGSWSVKGVRQVPYNFPNVRAAIERGECIYVVEGEKDVHNLRDLFGLVATCNAGGAGKWTEDHSKCLAGADVVWLPDNDDAGRSHVAKSAPSLRKFAKRQRVLDLPGLDEHDDVSDWIEIGNDKGTLETLVATKSRVWSPQPPESKFGAITWEHLDDRSDEEHAFIIDGFFTAGDLGVIGGPSGSGKSFLGTHAGLCVAAAAIDELPVIDFFGRKIVEGGLVVYQAGEGQRGIKKRLRAWRKHYDVDPKLKLPFVLLPKKIDLWRDKDVGPMIDEIKAWQAYYDLPLKMVVIDTLATAIPGAEENSAKDMSTVLTNCARIKDECGTHVCLIHHMNAQGTKLRGSTAIFAGLDNVITCVSDPASKVRTVSLDKQKDDEDNLNFRFELKSVELGYDGRRGKPITSCVCVEVGEKDAMQRKVMNRGLPLKTDDERTLFGAVIDGLKKRGVTPPEGCNAPVTVSCVVDFEIVREQFFRKKWRDDGDDENKHYERAKKAMFRAGATLRKFGVIDREKVGDRDLIWWTNKPVQGFPKTPIEPASLDEEGSGSFLDDLETTQGNDHAEEVG